MAESLLSSADIKYSMIREGENGSMSGIEVLGLLASVSQLVVYGLKITTCLSEICQKVRDTSLRIAQHSDQVRQLVIIVRHIENHRLLQTVHVHAQIDATLEQAISLSATLEQLRNDYSRGKIRRYWKTIQGGKEKEILANFDRLEKEKSSLLLCISVVNMDLLGDIQMNHKGNMGNEQGSWLSEAPEEDRMEVDETSTGYIADNEARTIPEEIYRQGAAPMNAFDRGRGGPFEQTRGEAHPNISRQYNTPSQSQESPGKELHHVYENVVAATNARCINGDAVTSTNNLPKHLYKNIRAEGLSDVLNGNVDSIEFFQAFFSPRHLVSVHEVTLRGTVHGVKQAT